MLPISFHRCWLCLHPIRRPKQRFCSADCHNAFIGLTGLIGKKGGVLTNRVQKMECAERWGWYECQACRKIFLQPTRVPVGGPEDPRKKKFRRMEWVLYPTLAGPIAQVHHIKFGNGDKDDSPENLALLCWKCHVDIHRGVIHPDVWTSAEKTYPRASKGRESMLYLLEGIRILESRDVSVLIPSYLEPYIVPTPPFLQKWEAGGPVREDGGTRPQEDPHTRGPEEDRIG